jgi:DNA repair protein RecO (recombination protein O)
MPAPLTTPAIVLRAWPFGESDKIVSFLTESHGKIRGIAKGAKRSRKRFANSLEPFAVVNLRFLDRSAGLVFIQACELLQVFKRLTTSLDKIAHASYFMELADVLSGERDENRALFVHLRDGLGFIDANEPSELAIAYFELKLLGLSGYQPMLEQCRRCQAGWRGRAGRWNFSLRDGGILCPGCSAFRREVAPLSLEAVEFMGELQRANGEVPLHLASFPPAARREGHLALLRFIQYQIGKELKSAPFLDAFST